MTFMQWLRLFRKDAADGGEADPLRERLGFVTRTDPRVQQEDIILVLEQDGAHRYRNLHKDVILCLYRKEIGEIMNQVPLTREDFAHGFFPLIDAAASLFSILPASQGCHDINAGGLFGHSLRVCVHAMYEFNQTMYGSGGVDPLDLLSLYRMLAVAALAHDLGKVYTDVRVVSGEDEFDPHAQTLQDFLQESSEDTCRVYFREEKQYSHDDLLFFCVFRLLHQAGLMHLTGEIARAANFIDFCHREGPVWQMVKSADADATRMAASLGKNMYDAPCFAVAKLLSCIHNGTFTLNTPQSDLFYLGGGVLAAYDGEGAGFMARTIGSMWVGNDIESCSDAIPSSVSVLKQKGYLAIVGRNRVYNWYRLTMGDDLVFVRGYVIKTGTIEGLDPVNHSSLGQSPEELSELFGAIEKEEGFTYPGKIILRGMAMCHGRITMDMLEEDSLVFGSAKKAHGEVMEKRTEGRRRARQEERTGLISLAREEKEESARSLKIAGSLDREYRREHRDDADDPLSYSPSLSEPDSLDADGGQTLGGMLLEGESPAEEPAPVRKAPARRAKGTRKGADAKQEPKTTEDGA